MSISQNKKVSVVVPNYNYGKYLRKRIESIIKQTYPIYELIVMDDASTDGSDVIAKNLVLDLKIKNPEMNVRFVGNKENSGKSIAQWKRAFAEAKGDYVWIAEADDLSSRKFLEEAMKGFDDPKVVLSYTESMIINGAGLIMAPNFRWSRDKEKTGHYARSYKKNGDDEIREIMAIRCTIPNVSGVVFRNDKKYMDYLDAAMVYSQVGDWYFYLRVLENGKISYSKKSLNKYRVHRESVTGKNRNGQTHLEEICKIHEMINEKYKLSTDVKRYMIMEEERLKGRMEK